MKKSRQFSVLCTIVFSLFNISSHDSYAAVQIGTTGNDLLFFQGAIQQFTGTIVNPYGGNSIAINNQFNVNADSYDGLAGIDTLFMTNVGDAIFIENPVSSAVMVSSTEVFFAGNGNDIIHLASNTFLLGDIRIDGGAGNDIIWGNVGNDTLNGRDGNDYMHGGLGNDILGYGSITSTPNNDVIIGGDGDDTFDLGISSSQVLSLSLLGKSDSELFVNSLGFSNSSLMDGGYLLSIVGNNNQIFISLDTENIKLSEGTFLISSLVTVPIPAAVWLFSVGLAGLIGISRRKAVV